VVLENPSPIAGCDASGALDPEPFDREPDTSLTPKAWTLNPTL